MENQGKGLLLLLLLVGIVVLLVWLRRKFKTLTLSALYFVSGEVKAGKTGLCVTLVRREQARALFKWWFRYYLYMIFKPRIFKKYLVPISKMLRDKDFDYSSIKDDDLKDYLPPMVYSNIPLANIKYNPLTEDIILGKVRIPPKSICLIDESSFFADSQMFKDKDKNFMLQSFYKLYGHFTHGGKCFVNSQSVSDNHFSLKRAMGRYVYIYSVLRLLFFSIMTVRELMYSDDNSVQNNFNEDVELSMRKVFVWNRTFDYYDRYCYSVFVDYLPVQVNYAVKKLSVKDDLKCYNIVSLNDYVHHLNDSIRGKYPKTAKSFDDKSLSTGDYYVDINGVICLFKEIKKDESIEA